MHFPHFNVPLLYRRPFVVTIHDLILLQHPTTRATKLSPLMYKLKFRAYRWVISSALRRASGILTVSKTSRKEIRKYFPFAERKQIVVTYGACAERFHEIAQAAAAAPKQPATGTEDPFMLYVGNAYPHKNLDRLIESFRLFRKRGHQNWRLFLVGAPDYFYERLQSEISESDRAGVNFYGQATDEDLAQLYREAQFYIFPSLCEGFGLPPLEAMCAGLPVAASNASCLPEVLGDAALFFDPEDPNDMAATMARLADDNELRQQLIAKGRTHAKRFDWKTVASKTLELYESCSNKFDGQHKF
jgi:glycosyltransferase involved in cell wall biosynthesis